MSDNLELLIIAISKYNLPNIDKLLENVNLSKKFDDFLPIEYAIAISDEQIGFEIFKKFLRK